MQIVAQEHVVMIVVVEECIMDQSLQDVMQMDGKCPTLVALDLNFQCVPAIVVNIGH